jgi:hypothetical protein
MALLVALLQYKQDPSQAEPVEPMSTTTTALRRIGRPPCTFGESYNR